PPAPPHPSPLSLHDALPIYLHHPTGETPRQASRPALEQAEHEQGAEPEQDGADEHGDHAPAAVRAEQQAEHGRAQQREAQARPADRKSTRLNSSHSQISYAV